MATVNSTVYGNQIGAAGASPSASYPLVTAVGAKLRMAVVSVPTYTGIAAADKLNLARLPIGAIPLPHLSYVVAENPGTALVVDIGFASNPDALSDGLDVSAGGEFAFTAGGTATVQEFNPAALAAGDEVITATVVTATSVTVGQEVTFYIAYLSE